MQYTSGYGSSSSSGILTFKTANAGHEGVSGAISLSSGDATNGDSGAIHFGTGDVNHGRSGQIRAAVGTGNHEDGGGT